MTGDWEGFMSTNIPHGCGRFPLEEWPHQGSGPGLPWKGWELLLVDPCADKPWRNKTTMILHLMISQTCSELLRTEVIV